MELELSARDVERFARLALACIHREYPNKIAHVLNSDADVRAPRALTPAFYGCFDWHSSVHGHWLLVRLLRLFPNAGFGDRARRALGQSFTTENLEQEAEYLGGEGRASFERPYGLAWLLQLCLELREWADEHGARFLGNIEPLENAALQRIGGWLPKLPFPVRSGEHSQTAFALGLMVDYAQSVANEPFLRVLRESAMRFYASDKNAPIAFEPSGEDFLSPSLAEADVMRRIFAGREFSEWLDGFFPQLELFAPAVSPDRSDGKLAHLDGLNLSRAWMLEGIASVLDGSDPRRAIFESAARQHAESGLAAVTGQHYEGAHWLGSFAVYLVTRRGIRENKPR